MHTIAIQTPVRTRMIGLFVGMSLIGTLLAPLGALPAQAQTIGSLQAQIQQLLAQIATLQSQIQGDVQMANYAFTRDLTNGSTGADVTALQQFLIREGHVIPAGATGYFGVQTQSALAAYQARHGIAPAAGYFGPVTRAYIASLKETPQDPAPGTGDDDKVLRGGAGTIDSFRLIPGFNNEVVGEREKDVAVSGIEITVDSGSDVRLRSVQLAFAQDTADSRFDKYADEVSLWLDDEEVARVDADEFTKRNNWTRSISLDSSAVIERGTTGELVVAVSGARNIDSTDEGETWTVDFRSIRFADAQNATISDTPNTGTRSFSFENFASAANVEMRISKGDETINNARVLNVHAKNKTKNVDIMAFDVKIEGSSDVTLDSLPVAFTATGAAHLHEMATVAHLYMDGKRISSENVRTNEDTVVFDKLDRDLRSGKTYEFVVKVDLLALSGSLNEGQTIAAEIGETQTNSAGFDAEDESGAELKDAHVRGSARSDAHTVYDAGIRVSLVSTNESAQSVSGDDNDHGMFTIKYRVEAFDDTVYVALSPAATTTANITDSTVSTHGVLYLVDKNGTAVNDSVTASVDWKRVTGSPSASGTGTTLRMQDGDVAEFTLTIARSNTGNANDNDFYHAALKAIGWNTDDSATFNVYNFDLGDYKTDPIYLN